MNVSAFHSRQQDNMIEDLGRPVCLCSGLPGIWTSCEWFSDLWKLSNDVWSHRDAKSPVPKTVEENRVPLSSSFCPITYAAAILGENGKQISYICEYQPMPESLNQLAELATGPLLSSIRMKCSVAAGQTQVNHRAADRPG
jgi:hypothetical protein